MSSDRPAPLGTASRTSERLDSDGIAWLWLEGHESYVTGYLSNLSDGGMFVTLTDPPPEGSELTFELSLTATPASIEGRGVVAWRRWSYEGPGRPPGIGIRFVSLEGDGAARLAEALGPVAEVEPLSQPGPAAPVVEEPVSRPAEALQPLLPPIEMPEDVATSVPAAKSRTYDALDPAAVASSSLQVKPAAEPFVPRPVEMPNWEEDSKVGPIPDRKRAWPELTSARTRRQQSGRRALLVVALLGVAAAAGWLALGGWEQLAGKGPTEAAVAPEPSSEEAASLPPVEAVETAGESVSVVAEPIDDTAAVGAEQGAAEAVAEVAVEAPAARPVAAPEPVREPAEVVRPVPTTPFTRVVRVEIEPGVRSTRVVIVGDGAMDRVSFTNSRMGGDNPRAILQLQGVQAPPDRGTYEAGTSELVRVRTGLHPGNRLHIVLDLARPDVDVADPRVVGAALVVDLK